MLKRIQMSPLACLLAPLLAIALFVIGGGGFSAIFEGASSWWLVVAVPAFMAGAVVMLPALAFELLIWRPLGGGTMNLVDWGIVLLLFWGVATYAVLQLRANWD